MAGQLLMLLENVQLEQRLVEVRPVVTVHVHVAAHGGIVTGGVGGVHAIHQIGAGRIVIDSLTAYEQKQRKTG